MYRVFVTFNDSPETETFYAESSYETSEGGHLVYWTTDKEDIVSYPVQRIRKITETEVES